MYAHAQYQRTERDTNTRQKGVNRFRVSENQGECCLVRFFDVITQV